MPVIIDQLDLVEPEPEATRDERPSSAPTPPAADGRILAVLRLAVQRAARVRAD